jgi:hypothetical protein
MDVHALAVRERMLLQTGVRYVEEPFVDSFLLAWIEVTGAGEDDAAFRNELRCR